MNNTQPLQACSYYQQQHAQIPPVTVNGEEEECDHENGVMAHANAFENHNVGQLNYGNGGDVTVAATGSSRTSELTIAFEGEVYVFPAVTPEKVQAVLLLLGGRDISSCMPSSEFLLQQNAMGVVDASRGSRISKRMASLVRFREKRKERCYEKKIRYTCRKEVAQRMHRKNGQFASMKDCLQAGEGNGDSSDGTSHQESCKCQHCGIDEKSTPAMRRGPAGPRTLCNACGLMWANKGTLRDLSKGARIIPYDHHTEPVTPSDIKPLGMETENSYHHQDEQGSSEETKPEQLNSNNHVRSDGQDLCEIAPSDSHPLPIQVDHSSVNLAEEDLQGALDEFANASASEFELPSTFDDEVVMNHSNLGIDWPGT